MGDYLVGHQANKKTKMFLSKLKIIGFKSFPDKTILNFTDGITSIVGPNGCGKTNIVDAIRWVLGEQKASILRSNKMEEVIFNGTQKKKPLGFCEATLTIENNKNLLPVEYDIVEITRRYYRSGDSEYYINKTQCRLKDIQDLFIDTGISSGAYSVIELKMIESILSQNPADRRSMIDEASGINNYNKQKTASTRRLISTKSDMDRIFDIMREVETNVKRLKLQMKRFDRHKVLSSELNAADYMYHKQSINDLEKKLKPLKISLEEKTKFLGTLDEELNKKEINLEKIQNKFEKTRAKIKTNQEELRSIEEMIIKNNQDIIISTQQIGHSKSRVNHFNNEILIKDDQIRSMELDIKDMGKLVERLIPEFKKRKNEYDNISFKNINLEKELSKFYNKRKMNRLNRQEVLTKVNSDTNMIDSNNRLIAEKKNLISSLKKEIHLNMKIHNNAKNKLDNYLKKINNSKKLKEKYKLTLSKLYKERNKIQELYRLKIKDLEKLKNNVKELSNRIDFYNKIIISKEGLTSGNKFLTDNLSIYKGVIGKVSDILSAPDKIMRAISMSLGEYSDYLIVDTLKNAMHITNELSNKEMSFNLIALDQIKNNKVSITDNHLISKIKYSKNFQGLVSLLLGDFILSNSFDTKLDKKFNYITLSGDMLSKFGIIKVNSNKHGSKMSINLEINNINKKIKKIKDILIIKNQDQINDIMRKEDQLRTQIEKNEFEKEKVSSLINELIIKIEQKKFITSENYNQARSKQINISNLRKEIVDFGLTNKTLSDLIKSNTNIMKEIDKEEDLLSKKIHNLDAKHLSILQNIQSKNINLIEISNKKNSLLIRIEDQNKSTQKIMYDIDRYTNETNKLNVLMKKLNLSKIKYKSNLKKFHIDEKNINKIKNKLDTEYSSEYQQFQTNQLEIKDKRIIKESSTENINKLIIDIEKIKSEKEFYRTVVNEIDMDLIDEVHLDNIKELITEDLLTTIEKNKKLIERIGPVNMEVDNQYKAEIERHEFLENQYSDLVKSKKYLEQTIYKLDTEARKRFKNTFEKIKINFSKTYNMFYEKGKAKLELKGDDVLDAEIIIKATPPGKSTQSLRMLSGGEKAITAIALLLAIYLVKPSPFCILDEVDSPLDDLNIKRFNNVIKEFSKNSQFIIITHNKLTMEASEYLYGVTQQNEGISKIVSVNLKDIKEKILV